MVVGVAGKVDFMADWISKMEAAFGAVTSWLKTDGCPGRKVKKLRNYHGNWPPDVFPKVGLMGKNGGIFTPLQILP